MNIESIVKNIPTPKMVVIAGSAGSLTALDTMATQWPESVHWSTTIVLHRSPLHEQELMSHLTHLFKQQVIEVHDDLTIKPSSIYLAPADYHTMIEDQKSFALCAGEKISYARPSIDVLLESASYIFKHQLLAILLSGANRDGTSGCNAVKNANGTVIAQDPETAESPTMPKSAIVSKGVDFILTASEISELIHGLAYNNEQ